jgi:hypothetical protein
MHGVWNLAVCGGFQGLTPGTPDSTPVLTFVGIAALPSLSKGSPPYIPYIFL